MALFDPKAKTIAQLQRANEEKTVAIRRYFDEIGRLYYGQYRDVTLDVSKEINTRCDAISNLYAVIEANKLRILFEKGLKICSTCKKDNPLEHAFCSACGAKFPDNSQTEVEVPTGLPPLPETVLSLIRREPVSESDASDTSVDLKAEMPPISDSEQKEEDHQDESF